MPAPPPPLAGLVEKNLDALSGWGLAVVGLALIAAGAFNDPRVYSVANGVGFLLVGISQTGIMRRQRKTTDLVIASEAEKRLQTGTGSQIPTIRKEMSAIVRRGTGDGGTPVVRE